jgi:hypothetical protein
MKRKLFAILDNGCSKFKLILFLKFFQRWRSTFVQSFLQLLGVVSSCKQTYSNAHNNNIATLNHLVIKPQWNKRIENEMQEANDDTSASKQTI